MLNIAKRNVNSAPKPFFPSHRLKLLQNEDDDYGRLRRAHCAKQIQYGNVDDHNANVTTTIAFLKDISFY